MNIIIPMAGMGKRMRPHTLTTAKPLIPIAGKPIVQRMVEDIVATCEAPVEYIGFIISPAFGTEVEKQLLEIATTLSAKGKIYYQEIAQGTAHAMLCAQELLQGPVFIAFADTLFDADFQFDLEKEAIIWTQRVKDPSAFGVVALNEQGEIKAFVEKPKDFVSDLAIIGLYYFKDGVRLRQECQRLLDENIIVKGEYLITDAMLHMLQNGVKFYTEEVREWLDCGNKEATVGTNQRILALKENKEQLVDANVVLENSVVIPPCYIAADVVLKNSVVGPSVSIEAGCTIEDSRIVNSIIQANSIVKNAQLRDSLLGKHVNYQGQTRSLSTGDYSEEK